MTRRGAFTLPEDSACRAGGQQAAQRWRQILVGDHLSDINFHRRAYRVSASFINVNVHSLIILNDIEQSLMPLLIRCLGL